MTVREMLTRIDSRELSEWAAYEQHAGPLGGVWEAETQASLHELLQRLIHMTGAAHFTSKKQPKNPAPEPRHYPRPHEVHEHEEDDEEDEEAEA